MADRSRKANGDQATGSNGRGVAFSHVYEKNGDVFVAVVHDVHGPQTRVVAVGKDGKVHTAASESSNGAASFILLSAMFSKVSLTDIRAFRLESRPYQWVEFRNVSLRPSQKTEVQIASAAANDGASKDQSESLAAKGTLPGGPAEPVTLTPAAQEQTPRQQMLKLPVRVVDADGKPVANAKITPWALRSSQGHGLWNINDKRSGVGPKEVVTAEDGTPRSSIRAIVIFGSRFAP